MVARACIFLALAGHAAARPMPHLLASHMRTTETSTPKQHSSPLLHVPALATAPIRVGLKCVFRSALMLQRWLRNLALTRFCARILVHALTMLLPPAWKACSILVKLGAKGLQQGTRSVAAFPAWTRLLCTLALVGHTPSRRKLGALLSLSRTRIGWYACASSLVAAACLANEGLRRTLAFNARVLPMFIDYKYLLP